MEYVEPFGIACIQNAAYEVSTDPADCDEKIRANLSRAFELMDYVTAFGRSNTRFIIMPEYGINGVWKEVTVKDMLKISMTVPGPYTDLIAAKARELGVYIAANVLEKDDDWPGRSFNSSFLINPEGEVVLKHWKITNNSWMLPYTTPSDIYTEFVERYGRQALFGVHQTPYGRVGLMTCAEMIFPEHARLTTLNGAEMIFHLSSEPYGFYDFDNLKSTRAFENKVIFASCNVGEFKGSMRGTGSSQGKSLIINWDGRILMKAASQGEATVREIVDINSVREARARPFWPTTLRAELYAKEYAEAIGWPIDGFADRLIESVDDTRAIYYDLLEKNYDKGLYTRPPKAGPAPG